MNEDAPSLPANNGRTHDPNSLLLPSPKSPGSNLWGNQSAEELLSSRASETSLASVEKSKRRGKRTHKERHLPEKSREREKESPGKQEDMFTRDRSRARDLSGLKKSVTTKVSDARAGLSRIRDAVGLRGSKSKPSPELSENFNSPGISASAQDTTEYPTAPHPKTPPIVRSVSGDVSLKQSIPSSPKEAHSPKRKEQSDKNQIGLTKAEEKVPSKSRQPDLKPQRVIKHQLHRPSSSEALSKPIQIQADPNACQPRRFSFSLVEESVLTWTPVWAHHQDSSDVDQTVPNRQKSLVDPLFVELSHENLLWTQLQRQLAQTKELENNTIPWVNEQTKNMETIRYEYQQNLDELVALYHEKTSDFTELEGVATKLASGDGYLFDEIKQIELLSAKLDYELKGLESRVEDVLMGLEDYEKRIQGVEARIHNIIGDEDYRNSQSWFHWLVSWLWGGPMSNSKPSTTSHSPQINPASDQ